jgi:hypothetical protein
VDLNRHSLKEIGHWLKIFGWFCCFHYLCKQNYLIDIIMRGLILFLMMVVGTLSMQATDYPYLTFELSDGSKASVSVTPDVALTFNGNTLTIGTKSFTLTNLSKMYFSTQDETVTGISTLQDADSDEIVAIYDLQGHQVSKDQMHHGIYLIKTNKGTSKVCIK